MNKVFLLIAAVMSYTATAASENTPLKTESVAVQSASIANKQSKAIKQVDSNGIVLKRHPTQPKVQRVESNLLKSTEPKYRMENPTVSSQANVYQFSVYDAWSSLDYDLDNDGFYSEFTVDFDVDYSGGYADVYAEMYLSLNGGPWILFNTTDIFTIYGSDASDVYSVSTALNYNFPTGYYDVAIDIYEAGYSGIVTSADSLDFNGLSSIPLEDNDHEYGSNNTSITYVASSITDDYDHDGFYTAITLEYDIDTFDEGRMVYARIDLTNADTYERTTLESDNFQIGNQTELLDVVLENGQYAGWYNLQITLIDSYTGESLAQAAQEYSSLFELPLESINNDNYFDDPTAQSTGGNSETVVVVHESGGGSAGWGVIIGLLLLIMAQNKQKSLLRIQANVRKSFSGF